MVHVNVTSERILLTKIKISNKKIMVSAAVGVLIILVAALVIIKMIPSGTETDLVPSVEDIQVAARNFAEKDDIDGGLKFYDEQIGARENEDEKKALLLYKAGFAQNAGRSEEALDAAQEADFITSDIATTQMLAQAYETQGNKEQALIYYKKLLEISPKEGMGARYNPMWEEKIEELEQ